MEGGKIFTVKYLNSYFSTIASNINLVENIKFIVKFSFSFSLNTKIKQSTEKCFSLKFELSNKKIPY